MKTVLFIAPHLSTGGLPQYLLKKIESLGDSYKVYLIEYEDITGGVLVVQKTRLKSILGENLISLPWGSDKQIIIDIIKSINPDIVHFEEMPEYFMPDSISEQIYTGDRTYKIFETSHDSSFDCNTKRFRPDKFILVSNYQVNMLQPLNIPCVVVEYPIEYKERPDRTVALEKLNLDPSYKHVLHVGLFTPRKNQQEFFEYARQFEGKRIIFHSVGNMADNFRYYWEPLIANKPSNVVVWGERNDVDDFYSSMDLFLFTSKGTVNDKETMPLVIREAISWKIPTLIYNLPVYENYFDKFDTIGYLDFDSFENNVKLIGEPAPIIRDKDIVIISCYPTTKATVDLTKKSVLAAKQHGYKVILTSHAKVPTELQEIADYVIYDSNNLLTHHDYYSFVFFDYDNFRLDMNIRSEDNHLYHGPAVYTNYCNGMLFAKHLGYDNVICFNFDMILTDHKVLQNLSDNLVNHVAVYNVTKPEEGYALRTVLFATNIDYFFDNFPNVKTEEDYNNWKLSVNSQSNGLENMFYNTLKGSLSSIKIMTDEEFYKLLANCEIDVCSMVEYFNVVSIKDEPNKFAIWFSTANQLDERKFTIQVVKDKALIHVQDYEIKHAENAYHVVDYIGGIYEISLYENDQLKKRIVVDQDYMDNKLKNNGVLALK